MAEASRESPHGSGSYGERPQRNLVGEEISVKKKRAPQVTDEGLFDTPVQANPHPEVSVNEPHRSLWFKKGTRTYSLDYQVPRTPIEEKNRRSGELQESQEVEIDPSNLVYSERIMDWTPEVKEEHKSKRYGAFVIAVFHIKGKQGEDRVVRKFISLKGLQNEEDNPLARFRRVTA